MMPSSVLKTEEGGIYTLSFTHDELGSANAEHVRGFFATEFLKSTAGIRRMVIDLTGVASLDSASLGPLVQKLREIQDLKGFLALAGVNSPALREIFALTRFDKVFPIFATRKEAVAAATKG